MTIRDTIDGLPQFSGAFENPRLKPAFTAHETTYLTKIERDIIHIINLMRIDPPGFARKVVQPYPSMIGNPALSQSRYYISLLSDLMAARPLPMLVPDKALFEFAQCHATQSGIRGYIGHDRFEPCNDKNRYGGECCSYGHEDALSVVMGLLIDERVPSLGHRKILMTAFTHIGVAMRPHKTYGFNTVLDLGNGL